MIPHVNWGQGGLLRFGSSMLSACDRLTKLDFLLCVFLQWNLLLPPGLPLSVLFIELWSCCFNPPPTPSLPPSFPLFIPLSLPSFSPSSLLPSGLPVSCQSPLLLSSFSVFFSSLWTVHPSSFHSVKSSFLSSSVFLVCVSIFLSLPFFISYYSHSSFLQHWCNYSSSCTPLLH